MKHIKTFLISLSMFSLATLSYGHCGSCGVGDKKHQHDQDIVATAVAAGNFTTLAAALEAAGPG